MGFFERLKDGFGLPVRVAGYAPVLAGVLLVPGMVVFASPGDWRTSVVPWFFAAIPACLAVTCLGLIRIHRSRWVTVGGAWTALALSGISGFFLAVGIGGLTGLQDLPEDDLGLLAWLPIISFGFGFLSLTPALMTTAVGAGKARILPRWAVWALWFMSPLLVVVFVLGGMAPAPIDELAAPVGLTLIMLGWVAVGQSLLIARVAQPTAGFALKAAGRWQFVLWWTIATATGLVISAALFFPIDVVTDGPVHKGLAGAAIGLGFGVGQWLFLRRLLNNASWWIVATLIGFGVAGFMMGLGTTDELATRGLSSEVVGFVLGVAAGVAQWVVLRRESGRAIWWIPASTAAFGLGWFLVWRLDYGLYSEEIVPFLINLVLQVVPFVLISALTLRWILHPKAESSTVQGSA